MLRRYSLRHGVGVAANAERLPVPDSLLTRIDCDAVLEYLKLWMPNRPFRGAVHILLGWLRFPLRYLDALLLRFPNAHVLGNHHYLSLRK